MSSQSYTSPPSITPAPPTYAVLSCTQASSPIPYSLPPDCETLWSLIPLPVAATTGSPTTTFIFYSFYRYYNNSEVVGTFATNNPTIYSDEARCLPPITASSQCPLDYAFGPCPGGYDQIQRAVQGGTTTDVCCPHLSAIISWQISADTAIYTWNTTMITRSANICYGAPPASIKTFPFTFAFNGTTSSVDPNVLQTDESLTALNPANIIGFRVPALQMTYKTTADTTASPGSTPAGPASSTHTTFSNSTLSSGAKAGIGVGVVVAVLALLVLCYLAWRRYPRRTATTSMENWNKQELPAQEVDKTKGLSEADGAHEIHEMQATQEPAEKTTLSSPVELVA